MISDAEARALVRVGAIFSRFSERVSKLPGPLQEIFLSDLETAIVERLRVLESAR